MKLTYVVLLLIFLASSCSVPELQKKQQERKPIDFFKDNRRMPVGAYYYPEHWDRNQWKRDIKNIAELGFDFTHYAEFAWARLEPRDGEFSFGWLDTCVELAAKYGLKVIMCTPTPCPPAWLTAAYPEVLTVNEQGITQRHGTRLHANGMNEKYQFYAKRIIQKMADRYGNHPAVWGWQIDNEPHFATLYDYSETAQRHFRIWLKEKYRTIYALNKAWGAAFWSMTYNSFDQIRIPNAAEGGGNPHALLDFKRFTADELAAFIRYQAIILKNTISDRQFITTNFAYYKFLPSVDLFRSKHDLDFASHTMYLLSTYLNAPSGALSHRLGSGMELSFSSELAASVNGYTGIMELQPGQINWGTWNAQPLPGAVRMWIWHSFALGDKFVCTYRFRQPIYGGELFHKGIMEPDGITIAPGGKEYVQAMQEIKQIVTQYRITDMPADYASRRTAFLWKQDNLWIMENQPHTRSWDSWQHLYTYYENLKTLGCKVTFLQESDSFRVEEYPFMVAPAYVMVDDKIVAKWTKYVRDGGHLVLSCRSGMKDNNGQLWEKMLQEPIWPLIDSKIAYYDHLPPSTTGIIQFDGKDYSWQVWADIIIPGPEAKVLAVHKDQFYAGTPVIVRRTLGKGTVTYIGTWTKEGELERMVLREVYTTAGATILDMPRYVFTEWRDGLWVTVNYASVNVEAPVHSGAEILLGQKILAPGGVCVWKQK